MEQNKRFYENSTQQLVNILELLSSQLSSNMCQQAVSHEHEFSNDNLDSDSFDSLLSRRSHDISTVTASSSQRPSLENAVTAADVNINNVGLPVYENVFYDNSQHVHADVHVPTSVNQCFKLPDHDLQLAAKMYRRCDSLNSVLLPPPKMSLSNETQKPSLINRDTGTRSRLFSFHT